MDIAFRKGPMIYALPDAKWRHDMEMPRHQMCGELSAATFVLCLNWDYYTIVVSGLK